MPSPLSRVLFFKTRVLFYVYACYSISSMSVWSHEYYQKQHANADSLTAAPSSTLVIGGSLYGGGPALLVGLALFAEIPRLS